MKRILLILNLAVAALGIALLSGCNQNNSSPSSGGSSSGSSSAPKITSAEKTSFDAVTSKLDPGGNLYLYLSTEQWLTNIASGVEKWRNLVESLPDTGDKHEQVVDAFNLVDNLIKDSGIQDVSGVGMSSIAREPGVYYNKLFVHHYAGQGNGFIWTMFGKEPHELTGLDLLPANTAMAAFYDLDAADAWAVLQKEVQQSEFPQATQLLDKLPENFEKTTGLKWSDVVDSLGGEVGFVITLDDSKQVSIPLPNQPKPLQIPEPAIMLVIKVNNETIFNRVDTLLKQSPPPGMSVTSTDKDGLKMRTVPVPLPLPITLRPTVASGGGYLMIASSDSVIQEAMAVKGGKPGLKSTDDFKKMSAGMPLKGNQFCIVSPRFGQSIVKIQQQAMDANNNAPERVKELIKSTFLKPGGVGFGYTVGANSSEGWMVVGTGNQGGAKILATAAVVPAAILAGVTLPAIAKAKAAAQRNAQQQSTN